MHLSHFNMVVFISNLALLVLAVPALAIPTSYLSERDMTSPNMATCDRFIYTQARVWAAAQAAAWHIITRTIVGQNGYPHRFMNYPENFVFHASCNAPYYEFPILQSGSIFTGTTSPGPDRVVIGSMWNERGNMVLCGS
ncbi:unnamed protein product [Rhizoctonia solani]|uniref:Uncharacterized protein n=1 Tax=Rhizoctonia solani TaxID=456999 RepID=A0A8H3I3I8_9AGAM|nr:unnamed protein product [Rhizoctonia solani]